MRADRPLRGFTMIELLIVISIMILLTTLSLSGLVRSLRTSAVIQGISDLRSAASAAQERAMRKVSTSGQAYPGILLYQDAGRWKIATVEATAAQASAVTATAALADAEGRPSILSLSPNVAVWLGDDPATTTSTLAWFYEPATGRVVIPSGGGFSAPGAMVGYSPPALMNGTESLVFGATSAVALPIAAPPGATQPGLSFRSRDQRTKFSVIVQPSGTIQTQEFN